MENEKEEKGYGNLSLHVCKLCVVCHGMVWCAGIGIAGLWTDMLILRVCQNKKAKTKPNNQ